jgi:hypothetical protein
MQILIIKIIDITLTLIEKYNLFKFNKNIYKDIKLINSDK